MSRPADDRSPVAKAAAWSARILAVALEMVLPGLLGYWIDTRLGTKVLFMLVGFCLGCSAATLHLIHMTRSVDGGGSPTRRQSDRERGNDL